MERAMSDLFQEPDDATPLPPSEREGLRQSWITYRRDLNEAEQENILTNCGQHAQCRFRPRAA
jgi:fido (protein-threonine AMPylation protein)